ncbi:uncharacterized protein si:ch73-70k4.1 isoform X3 [Maylandia zebra]|uniref:uncharacterized protein si:ch73-70k4.1 isoform X3 n=1 Tax=Astatotilapia calliptera TaxID=8154 RepID=UPI000E41C952|nr:Fanconi anemia core complex-associated protein 20 isoform X3 [Astatotilapia calliptera]
MEENHLKSRLKRKKSTVEASGGAPKRSPTTSSNNPAKSGGPTLPAGAWWNRQQLLAVESLWAFTLQATLPCLEEQLWDQVPDLPHASAAIPDPVGLSSSPEDPTAHTSTVPEPPVRGPCSHSMESSTHSPQTLSKTRRPSLHSWVEALPSPGFSSAGKEEGRKATGPVSRKLPTYWVKVSDRVPLQNEVEAKKEEEVQGCGKKDGGRGADGGAGGGLQSCPMCLQVFPAGFTQMDCDGHLAHCLSEMNVDMTW